MPRKLPSDKNPAHPSALRVRDITPGRHIVVFRPGYSEHYIVLSAPYIETLNYPGITHKWLAMKVRSLSTGHEFRVFLSDCGIERDGYGWNANFTVDHRKAHLVKDLPPSTFFDFSAEIEEEEYDEE